MKTAFWLASSLAAIALGSGAILDARNTRTIEQLTAQRDSIAELHTRSMLEWAELQKAMQTQVEWARLQYVAGNNDPGILFDAGVSFGAYLERYTYDMTKGLEHWDTILDDPANMPFSQK